MTADGCACDGRTQCLFHWYYETKDRNPAAEEKINENFPGRKPSNRPRGGSQLQDREGTGEAPRVRGDDRGNRNRSGRAVRGKRA
jgi:hypothetical protein